MTSLLAVLTPVNLSVEKDKFFESESYSPVFRYGWQAEPPPMKIPNTRQGTLLKNIYAEDAVGITRAAEQVFETVISPDLTVQAEKIVAEKKAVISQGDAGQFADMLRQAFRVFHIPYKVHIVDHGGFNARPVHHKHVIEVSAQIHFEMFSLEGGVRHDLTHVMRYLNGQANHVKRSADYLPTEEGLASYTQDRVPGVVDNSHAQHAIEYLASAVGLQGSLRDIFNFMCASGMSRELAWKRASRHKFGFTDTSVPGDILKPAMYFANEQIITGLSSDERVRLFIGKIAVRDLPGHPVYDGRWPGKMLIDYFNL